MDTYKLAVSKYKVDHKLPPGDPLWHKFNSGFDNQELDVYQIAEAVYEGQAITTQHKDHWRSGENYVCGQHIGLDFDHGDCTLDKLKADKFISKYGAFLYTTMSHKPEEPRSRAIFLLDAPIMQAKNYTMAATSLLWLFGTADRQCKDAVRFFYGSPGCEVEFIENVLPIAIVQKLIADYLESGAREKKKSARSDFHAPANQEEVQDALKAIPPWQIDYDEWVSVLMAIHSHFGEGGYSLAENWGDGKPGEVEHKWKSFKTSGNGAGAITIATVFGIAKRFGWRKTA
jgi:hypothetical protein